MCKINHEKILNYARKTYLQLEIATLYKTIDKKVRPVNVL